jgi:sarcosine oxidase subunit alpha
VKQVQVAVVGGGPAGRAAATAATSLGAEIITLDEREGSLAWGLFDGNVLGVVEGSTTYQLQADQVILATGSTDLPCPFPGGSLPGVFTSQAMRIMLSQWRVMPGKRYVVIGDGVDGDEITKEIESANGQVVARVLTNEASNLTAIGDRGIEAVEINGVHHEADVVVIELGRQPDIELALMAECAIGYSQELGGFVPLRDKDLRTTQPSILVAGDSAGICDSLTAVAEGRLAGVSAAKALGLIEDSILEEERMRYLEETGDRATLAMQVVPGYVQV